MKGKSRSREPLEVQKSPLQPRAGKRPEPPAKRKTVGKPPPFDGEGFFGIFHALPTPAMICRKKDGRCMDTNNSCLNLFGLSRRQIIGRSAYDLASPDNPDAAARFARKLHRHGFLSEEPITIRGKSGEIRNALWSAHCIDFNGENVMVSSYHEVTRVEDQLRQNEAKYKSVVDNIGIGVALISPKMEILALNPQMEKWYPQVDPGRKPICYKAFNNPPRKRICADCPTFKTLRDGECHEWITETPTGSFVRNFRIISTPIRDRHGNIAAAIEMVEDYTEKKQIQEQLKESEKWYRTIFETSSSGTVVIEEDLTISYMNKAFEARTGFSKSEVEGRKKWTDFIPAEDLAAVKKFHDAQRAAPAAPGRYETRYICRGGKIRDVLATAAIVPGTGKSVLSLMDITRLKRIERSLKEREEELSIKSSNLEELNAALRALLKQRDEDRIELEENVLTNVKNSILPSIEKLNATHLDRDQSVCLEALRAHLRDIISPFLHRVTQTYFDLTPHEIQVAGFIKDGMTSKEIAGHMGISIRTVDSHRDNIREKLGIKNRKTSLSSFLLKFS